MTESVSIRVDGLNVYDDALSQLALVNYGHFTAMQIRGGRVKGLSPHLDRLKSAHAELYGTVLDPGIVLDRVREAANDVADSYLRVTLFETEPGAVRVMTAVRAPVVPSSVPVGLLPVIYQRPVAHIKHVGSFGQLYYGRLARQHGFDDAVLTTVEGEISETTTANIAFIDGDGILVWPSAPSLYGVTWQILDASLAGEGIRARRQRVTLRDMSGFAGALVTSSVGVVGVSKVGGVLFTDNEPVQAIADAHGCAPWDSI